MNPTTTRAIEARPTVLRGVSYATYVRLRNAPGNDGFRMTYFDGTLELMSPAYAHEMNGVLLGYIVREAALAFSLPFQETASTTFRRGTAREQLGVGKEPDLSFYFAHSPAILGKTRIDLDVDPPPDLWIEVDHRGSSRGRLPLYATFGAPELWQYRVRTNSLVFSRLVEGSYEPIVRSVSLPMLTPGVVLEALEVGRGLDSLMWTRWLRADWSASLANP